MALHHDVLSAIFLDSTRHKKRAADAARQVRGEAEE
jgi:hypothetical protein